MASFDVAIPTATAREHRLRLFQPTRRPVSVRDAVIKTAWGKVVVSGRIGQGHADVLDAICHFAEMRADMEDGRIKLLVDPAKIRRACGLGGEQLKKIVRELREVSIQIDEPKELMCIGGLIDHVQLAVREDGTPVTRHNPLGHGERVLWRVELGKALCMLVKRDAWISYDPTPIAKLDHGISQAIARHVMSHEIQPTNGWTLDGLIRAVSGGEIGEIAIRNRRREVHQDANELAALGIEIAGDRVRRV